VSPAEASRGEGREYKLGYESPFFYVNIYAFRRCNGATVILKQKRRSLVSYFSKKLNKLFHFKAILRNYKAFLALYIATAIPAGQT
jgi:hypothetical protein